MKSKVIYLLCACLLVCSCIVFQFMGEGRDTRRTHQHQQAESIPVIEINTNGQKIPGASYYREEEDQTVTVVSYDKEPTENIIAQFHYRQENGEEMDTNTRIHVRGKSSRWFLKSSYSLHLIDEKGEKDSRDLAGMGECDEWVLNGPFLDKTLLRNYMCMNISGEIMEYAPEVAYVELYIDGEYQGLYLLMETIEKSEERLNLKKSGIHAYATSFIVKQERGIDKKEELNTFSSYTYKTGNARFLLEYPGQGSYTELKKEYVCNEINEIEKKLYSYDLFTYREDYAKDLDMDSFAEYFIINEFFGNMDAGFYSTYFYRDVRGKVKTCVWDFNNSCDNYMDHATGVEGFHMQKTPWFEQLVKDERFVQLVIRKYRLLRRGVLNDEYLQQYITDTITWLGDRVERNYEVWGDSFEPSNYKFYERQSNFLSPVERNPGSYDEAVEQLRTYITQRGNWLDDNIDSLNQYCQDSKNTNEKLH